MWIAPCPDQGAYRDQGIWCMMNDCCALSSVYRHGATAAGAEAVNWLLQEQSFVLVCNLHLYIAWLNTYMVVLLVNNMLNVKWTLKWNQWIQNMSNFPI